MTDPRRLMAGDATEFERLLLGAARHEQPTSLQRRRMRRALVLAEFGILATSAKAIAGLANHVVVMAVVASSLAGITSSSPAIPANDASALTSTSINGTGEPDLQKPSSLETLPYDATAEHLPLVDDSPTDSRAAGRARNDPASRHLPALHEEIALLDQARTALRSGAPSTALAMLERYRTQFPRGSFGQEVTVLRIEALAASGNRSRAVAEAQSFLAKQPKSPHAERLRLVIGKVPPR